PGCSGPCLRDERRAGKFGRPVRTAGYPGNNGSAVREPANCTPIAPSPPAGHPGPRSASAPPDRRAAGMTFDTRSGKHRRVASSDAQPGRQQLPDPLARPESPVTAKKPQFPLLSLAVTVALAACNRDAAPADASAAAPDATAITLDEGALPPVNRLEADQLDTSVSACTDFTGFVNDKWLAANEIPGDRTSWGAFEMLDERSTAVQRQLAEQAAAMEGATGVVDIVGDMWATGMDEAAINATGIQPIQGRLDAIAALDSQDAVARYMREAAARGEGQVFSFEIGRAHV